MKFRTKLVLWHAGIVLVTLVAFRLASVGVIRGLLENDFDESLRAEARWVERLVRDYRTRGVPDAEIVMEIAERSRLAPRKEFIEVRDGAGQIVFRSPNLEDASLRSLARPPVGEPSDGRLGRIPVRVLVVDASGFEVAVGYPLNDMEAAVGRVIDSLVYLIPLAILLACIGGIVMATRFLRPLKEMEGYADRVVTLPLDQALPAPPDAREEEIRHLLERIHHLVSRLRENLRRSLAFSSLASHELRTPLAVVRVQLEGALQPTESVGEVQDAVAGAYDEILGLTATVSRLLEMSTLQAGTLRLDLEPVDLAEFLDSFTEDVRPLCESRGATIQTRRSAEPMVRADRVRLRQVLYNLLDNALKHVRPGGRLDFHVTAANGSAILRVEDDGEGIPEDRLKRIFEPFYSGPEEPARSDAPGAGLGLAYVRWILEEHGGRVVAESTHGAGTAITLHLPLVSRSTGDDRR